MLAPVTLSLLTERRVSAPWGQAGGRPGTPGRNTLRHADGEEEPLPAKGTWHLEAGDTIRLETPGGGGWGEELSGD
jgi:N-methylhydantoinase B